jgi:hypothetical protein
MVVGGKETPHLPGPCRIRTLSQGLHRNALAVKHAEHVVVRKQKQRRGIRKRLVLGEPARIGVTVRAEDGELACVVEDAPGDAPGLGIGGKEAVRV